MVLRKYVCQDDFELTTGNWKLIPDFVNLSYVRACTARAAALAIRTLARTVAARPIPSNV
jgi:hypothetical protein